MVSPWCVTVPSLVREGSLLALSLDAAGIVTLDVPYQRELNEIDEAAVWQRGRDFVREGRVMASRVMMGVESAFMLAQRAYFAGYVNRVGDERRATCKLDRDRFRALLRVVSEWPVFDAKHNPLMEAYR